MGTRRLDKIIKKFEKTFLVRNKKKFFLALGIASVLILSSPFVLKYLSELFPRFEKEPQVSMSASVLYGNLSNGFDSSSTGLQVELWENDVFQELLYTDGSSQLSFMANLNRTYQLRVIQGTTTTVFDYNMTSDASNDFLIDGWDVDLWVYLDGVPSDDFDLYKYIDGVWEFHAVIRTDGTGNYYLGTFTAPNGTYGVISEMVSKFFNFSITQTDNLDFYQVLDIVDIFLKPKRKKKSKNVRRIKIFIFFYFSWNSPLLK